MIPVASSRKQRNTTERDRTRIKKIDDKAPERAHALKEEGEGQGIEYLRTTDGRPCPLKERSLGGQPLPEGCVPQSLLQLSLREL